MDKEVRVLIIYEVIPETLYKTVVVLSEEDYDLLKRANNYIVNVSAYSKAEQDASLAINYAFAIQESPCFADTNLQVRFFRRFKNMTSKELAKALTSGVDDVIHSGFLM